MVIQFAMKIDTSKADTLFPFTIRRGIAETRLMTAVNTQFKYWRFSNTQTPFVILYRTREYIRRNTQRAENKKVGVRQI